MLLFSRKNVFTLFYMFFYVKFYESRYIIAYLATMRMLILFTDKS